SPTQAQRATLLLAQAHRLALRPERAVALLEETARGSGAEAEQAQVTLAQTLGRDLGDARRAAQAWQEAARRFPGGIFAEQIAFRRGEALLKAGEVRPAVAALDAYLARWKSG